MEYSKNLWIGELYGESVAEIRSTVGRDTLVRRFVLRKEAARQNPIPKELKGATVLQVPLKKLVTLSSAQIGYLVRLGMQDRIVGVGETRFVYDSSLYARAQKGEVAEVGNGGELVLEKVLALKPDLVMTFATGGGHDDYERINALGIPLMLTSEWQEETPLAKAEWIKLFGLLIGEETLADSIFRQSKEKYNAAKDPSTPSLRDSAQDDTTQRAEFRIPNSPDSLSSIVSRLSSDSTPNSEFRNPNSPCPRVLVGMSYGGVWYAPGGNSFTAKLIKDAGGCYLWASDTSHELKFNLEEIMLIADSADVWVNPGMFSTPQELLSAEPRVKYIKAFENKRVCQNDGRKGPGGGNDFFESAVAYPAEVLQNLRNCLQNATKAVNSDFSGLDWYHNIFIF